jgi:hypothetical protein
MASVEVRHEVEIRRMERVLRQYGCLTRDSLFELCGASHWPVLDAFHRALAQAVAEGRIRALSDELVELPHD